MQIYILHIRTLLGKEVLTRIPIGLIRQYFSKGTDFNKITNSKIEFVMNRLNTRDGKQPVELFLVEAVDLLTA
jgi:hypothetical protein